MTTRTGFAATVDLIERAQSGDTDALSALLARYAPRVREIVSIRLGASLRARVETADLLQETLVEALRGFDRFEIREDAHFLSWLARIAERQVLRSAEHHAAARRDPRRAVPLEAARAAGSAGPSPATSADLEEQRRLVADCVAELPERYRHVIAERDYAGADWASVARETGLATANAARMAHHRARVALGALLRRRGLWEEVAR